MVHERIAVLVELTDPEEGAAAVVLSAAMQLLTPDDPVDVVLFVPGTDEPGDALGELVTHLCLTGAAGGTLPETLLLGAAEALARPAALHVVCGTTAADAARAVALLTGLAQSLVPPPSDPVLQGRVAGLEAALLRARVDQRAARRDVAAALAIARGERRPCVALVFQHRSYWNAVATVAAALDGDERVDLMVVALDSDADGKRANTGAFLRHQGYDPVSGDHLLAHLADVDVVLFDNPYDEMRPPGLTASALADKGVRLASVPYGGGAIAGELMDTLLWNLPLQQLAWRSYVPTEAHRDMYQVHCRTGSEQVRVVGSAKLDRLVEPGALPAVVSWRGHADGRPVVLWNPHFRLGPGGWSTFDTYFEPVLRWFIAHPDVVLLLRPHFRLFRDLAAAAGPEAKVEAVVRRLVDQHENLLLDEDPDYVPALLAADVMMSDLSSLAGEYLVTGRPLLYLHRADGPGPNAVGGFFSLMERAEAWPAVRAWLDRVRCGTAQSPEQGAVAEAIGPHDGGAGRRIADDLVQSLTHLLRPEQSRPQAQVVTVQAASVGADGVTVDVEGPVGLALRWQDGPRATESVPVVEGRALLPTRASLLGGPVAPLPSGTYRLSASLPQGRAVVRVAPDAWAEDGASWCDSGSATTLRVLAGDVIDLLVEPPLVRDTDGARVVEQATYPSARTQPLVNAVLLSSYQGTAAACSPRAIDTALQAAGHDATRYWLVADLSVEVPGGSVPVVRGSKEHYEIAATARWIVDNEAMPVWLRKRPGQTLLQTWHGTPLKALRWDLHAVSPRDPQFMEEADRDAGAWDVVLSPNPHSSEVLRRAFRVTGEVLEVGYPRNDVLADPVRRAAAGQRARTRLGIAPDAPVVLHAPTWRDGAVRRSSRGGSWSYGATWGAQPMLDPVGLHEALGEGGVLLYRGHRFVAGTAPELQLPGVLDVTAYPDMADLLAAADLLVTDYSSSLFDFALTGRPMLLFAYDLEDYRDRQRGLYLDMETDLPGPVVRTPDEVSSLVAQHHLLPVAGSPTYDAFVSRFAPWDDGRAAERVVQAVFG